MCHYLSLCVFLIAHSFICQLIGKLRRRTEYLRMCSLVLLFLLSLAVGQATRLRNTSWCKDFDWTEEDVQAIDDCDILKKQLSVKVSMLTSKSECIEIHSLKVGGHSKEMKYNTDGKPQEVVTFTNALSVAEAIEEVLVSYDASLDNPIRNFKTSFTLNSENCLKTEKRTTKDLNKDQEGNILPYLSVIIITAVLCLALVIVVYLVVRRKKEVQVKIGKEHSLSSLLAGALNADTQ